MSRKPRSDAKLLSLPTEQQEQLASWLTEENLSYAKARQRVKKEFGVSTSAAALQGFYSSFAAAWRYARAKGAADEFAQLSAGQFDEATTKRLQQLLFELAVSQKVDLKAVKSLAKVIGDSHKLTLQRDRLSIDLRKVKLLEAKAALTDKASGIAGDEKLTDDEKGAQLRSLFGMG